MQGDELAHKIIDALSAKQAEDILLLDIRNVASFADYFVIASAQSGRQMEAAVNAVEESLSAEGATPMGREGEPASGWVLLDYGDVILHLFAPEERAYYDLESLWHAAIPVVRLQ
ncbi:MAG: ribosome silencing factor [Chloroflexi bacterium]|nr:MAG: ribosome silencing factor [Chloroflexota bacterium]